MLKARTRAKSKICSGSLMWKRYIKKLFKATLLFKSSTKERDKTRLIRKKIKEIRAGVLVSFKLKKALNKVGSKHWKIKLKAKIPKHAPVISTAEMEKAPVLSTILTIKLRIKKVRMLIGIIKYRML